MKTFAAIFVFLLLLLCHSWFGPDIWYHLTWGRDILTNFSFMPAQHTLLQQPVYANMYWLFQVIVSVVYNIGGVHLGQFLFASLWLMIALLWVKQTECLRAPTFGGLFFLAFVVCAQLRFEPRPEVFSYLFLSVFILLLRELDFSQPLPRRQLVAIFLCEVLWTNCHGYFVLGPCVVIALGLSLHGSSIAVARRALLVLGLTVAATFVSPFGWGVWRAVWAYALISRDLREWNAELMPPSLWPLFWPLTIFWLIWILAAAGSVATLWRRRAIFAGLLGLGGCVLALTASRNLPLFLILTAPILREVIKFLEERWRWSRWPAWVAMAAATGLSVLVVTGDYHNSVRSLGSFGVRLEPSAFPLGAVDFLKRVHFQGKIFADSYDGGYIEYALPGVTPVGDSYFSDPLTTLQYFAAIRDPRALAEMNQRFGFQALLINVENSDEVLTLSHDPVWRPLYLDSHRVLFVRRDQFPEMQLDMAQSRFYSGENLRHWANAFGVSTWAKIALNNQDLTLMRKIFSDTASAPVEPAGMIGFGAILAARTGDQELIILLKQAAKKLVAEDAAEATQVRDLLDKIGH